MPCSCPSCSGSLLLFLIQSHTLGHDPSIPSHRLVLIITQLSPSAGCIYPTTNVLQVFLLLPSPIIKSSHLPVIQLLHDKHDPKRQKTNIQHQNHKRIHPGAKEASALNGPGTSFWQDPTPKQSTGLTSRLPPIWEEFQVPALEATPPATLYHVSTLIHNHCTSHPSSTRTPPVTSLLVFLLLQFFTQSRLSLNAFIRLSSAVVLLLGLAQLSQSLNSTNITNPAITIIYLAS